ncbi:hypothetical protein [Staphylococcus pseudoxylosus]|uniref:hypothetical protein n=1 Tax=Staphylococcus pseudoxylosus TaxID=2282419 RepID=UPI00398A5547
MGKKWSRNQVLNIVLNAKDLIGDIQERVKENQKKSIEVAHRKNPNHRLAPVDVNLSKPLTPTKQNREIVKLTGVSGRSLMRDNKQKNAHSYGLKPP